ncbi:hypothetical protein GYH30_040095 [Glycine max]|nr:hypothetical protein GYH30_040095 [Glycine max]
MAKLMDRAIGGVVGILGGRHHHLELLEVDAPIDVCNLYCGDDDADKWVDAQIGHYIGIDAPSSRIEQMLEA